MSQLIIYDKIINTNRYYLLEITATPIKLMRSSIAEKSLEYKHSDYFKRTLTSETIEPVGEKIIKQIFLGVDVKKLQEI